MQNVLERHLAFAAIRCNADRGLGRKIKQGAKSVSRAGAGAQFQHLAKQNQHDDHRRGLEVDGHGPRVRAHGVGKEARKQYGHETVEKRRTGAEGQQRPHIRAVVAE